MCTNPVSKRIFSIMSKKSSNLCVSADVTTMSQLLKVSRKKSCLQPVDLHIYVVGNYNGLL